jgi:hypothetical protein
MQFDKIDKFAANVHRRARALQPCCVLMVFQQLVGKAFTVYRLSICCATNPTAVHDIQVGLCIIIETNEFEATWSKDIATVL